MKASKYLILLLAATITFGGILGLCAASAKSDAANQPARGRLLNRAKEKLGLSNEQINRIKMVLKEDREYLTGLLSRMHEARTGLRESIRAADANESSVRAASAKVALVEADLAVERLKLFGKISPILTADQREKLQELQAQLDDVVESLINRMGNRPAE